MRKTGAFSGWRGEEADPSQIVEKIKEIRKGIQQDNEALEMMDLDLAGWDCSGYEYIKTALLPRIQRNCEKELMDLPSDQINRIEQLKGMNKLLDRLAQMPDTIRLNQAEIKGNLKQRERALKRLNKQLERINSHA